MSVRETAALEQQQLLEALQEVIALTRILPHAQRIRRDWIGTWRTTETEIDTAGIECLQHLEAFSDHERCMVRQHDAARADANERGARRDLANHDFRGRAADIRQVVMLG